MDATDARLRTDPPVEFGSRIDSRFVDGVIIGFALFGAVLAFAAIDRGLRHADDWGLLILGAGIGAVMALIWRRIRRPGLILHADHMVVHKLIRSHVISYAAIAEIAMYTRYFRQLAYRPPNPLPEHVKADTLLLRNHAGGIFRCRLPYSPAGQPVMDALSDRTGLPWEQLEGISAWRHRPRPQNRPRPRNGG